MRYIAEIISTEEIAIWVVEDGYVGEMKDGMYSFIGRVKSPILPDHVSIEYKNKGKEHFKPQDYENLLRVWNSQSPKPPQPPFPWIAFPNFSPSCRLPLFGLMAIHNYSLPTVQIELTDKLKESIKQQFNECQFAFDSYHGDTKAILIGTI
jgi:hypothetical protein